MSRANTPQRLFTWYLGNPAHPVLVGEIGKLSNGDATLVYAPSWMREGFALSEDMPLVDLSFAPLHRRFREPGAPGALDDATPDRWGEKVIRYLYKKGATLRDYLYLAGDDRFGALGVSASDVEYQPFNRRPLPRLADVQDLAEAAAIIENNEGELGAQREQLIWAAGSLGGAKPKALISMDGAEWVVKFFNGEPWDQPLVEHACMSLARQAGIRTATTQVIRLATETALAVRRFDRAAGMRVHSLSASTLIRAATPRGEQPRYGYPQLARRLRAVCRAERMDEHLQELFRRMAFNILIGNTDDHEKNHAVTVELVAGLPVVNLSAAFDVVTTGSGAYGHEFMIADDVVEPSLAAALSVHTDFGLSAHQAQTIVSQVVTVVDGWQTAFAALGVTPADRALLAAFIDSEHLLAERDSHRSAPPAAAASPRRPKRGTPGIFR